MKILFRLITNWTTRINSLNWWKLNPAYPNKKDKKIKLIYRGVRYEYNPLTAQVKSEIGGLYRGSSWRIYQLKKSSIQIKITQKKLNYRSVKYPHKLIQIKNPPDLTSLNSTPIFQGRKLPSTQPKDREPTERDPQQLNSVELNVSQDNQKEIGDEISEIIYPPNLNSCRLVLDRDIFKDKLIATSGEAEIWTITGEILINNSQNHLAKIYHQKTSEQIKNLSERGKKLEVMVVHQTIAPNLFPNHVSLAWPQYLLENSSSEVVGFLMPFIEGYKLTKSYHPRLRQSLNLEWDWQVDWQFLHQTARNLALIIQFLHSKGYVIGDMKPENILVNQQALPSIIDTDSFQIRCHQTGELYRCLVGSENFTPPELLGENFAQIDQDPTHDRFRLAVIIYHLLFGEHPFKGWRGDEDPPPKIDDLIRQGFWCYASHSLIQPGVRTIPLDIIHPQVKECFLRCFNEGHDHPNLRPTATDWANALQAALNDLVHCKSFSSHWYSKTYGRCYWCERKESLGKDIFSDDTEQYKKLNMLLKAGKWKEADLETKYLMLKISSRFDKGWLDESAIVNFPLQDLSIINQLWLEHSSERFGFSVQKRIYIETGNQPGGYDRETYNRFAEAVGWREDRIWKNYFDLEFSLSAPDGHLPWCCAGFDVCLVSYLSVRSFLKGKRN
ncbi:GUN4 domain-containing protein [Iningainema tapete]|uniref:GUN4 domain-containing protein n=1 Tax=Iningainema tapete BLCC-T55 TaxID=2748662 RepID=A0A8J6XG32_9CYAN|nr:GUN4 domain-containing protein [Iningainema tapete]MBD2770989.1 GUN4 domain-containing protein [Iningainema tapete BLCC-T55]